MALCPSKPDHAAFDGNTEADSHGIAGQVAPEEAKTQHQAPQRRPADRVDPGCMIQLTDLDQERNGQGECGDPTGRCPGLYQAQKEEESQRPTGITSVLSHETREM